jgi:hypothetical protein
MMHIEDFIVFISVNKKPIREYNIITGLSSRSSNIYLNPGTEYEFGFKNRCNSRRRLNITIDGSVVAESLIVDKWSDVTLERFMDTDSKFMTALKNDSRVSDPTNKEIGKIEVEVFKETGIRPNLGILRSCPPPQINYPSVPSQIDYSVPYCQWSTSSMPVAQTPVQNNLATIEGNQSNQTFITTTWNSDEFGSIVFRYNLFEKNTRLHNNTHKFCINCGNKNELNNKFCPKCGNKL